MASDQKTEPEGDGPPVADAAAPETATETAATETPTETTDAPAREEEPDPEPPETPFTEPPETPFTEPTLEPLPVRAPPELPRRGGVLPAVLGGAVAALLGLLAGKAGLIDPLMPAGWRTPDHSAQIAGLDSRIAGQADEIRALDGRVGGIVLPDLAPLGQRIDAVAGGVEPLAGQIATLGANLSDLESRLAALEKRPISEGVSQEAIAAYERELTRMKETLAAQRAEVEGFIAHARSMEAEAGQSRQVATQRNALTRLQTALTEGAPYAAILDELRAAGLDVPAPLAEQADRGVATLAALRADFPDAARQALAAAREAGKGDTPGLSAFLARQFGARSVAPKAGDDPDAILSRAEAAVTDGRIDTALVELEALPEAARPPLATWTGQASRRQAAMTAADSLAQTLASK